jgi:hypothetical protein
MIYLQTNAIQQTVFISLDETRQYFSTPFTHYLFILTHEENSTTGSKLAQVATIVNENVRITELSISTDKLSLPGRYRYDVYGQNSGANVNPNNASVVGLLRRGYAVLTNSQQFFDVPSITIPNDIIYEP